MLWLKAFDEVTVSSIYSARDGSTKHRQFRFRLPKGVQKASNKPCADAAIRTSISLTGFDEAYANSCPKKTETIAERLMIHLATSFLDPQLPHIELYDDASPERIVLNDRFQQYFKEFGTTEILHVGSHEFTLHHLRLYTSEPHQNNLQLAANFREVEEVALKNQLPGLAGRLEDEQGNGFFYLGVLTGALLDERVTPSRTGFNLPKDSELVETGIPTLDEIVKSVTQAVVANLSPFLESTRSKTRQEIRRIVETQRPEYRPLMSRVDEAVDSFPVNASPLAILRKLNDFQFESEEETRAEAKVLLSHSPVNESEDYKRRYQAYLNRVTEESEARLAQHVTHRRAILDVLIERLKLKDDDKFELEAAVHELIFPMKTTSDDPGVWGHQNLWLVDERLAYHRYLASDKPLKSQEAIESESSERPDFLIINRPGAFSSNDHAGTVHNTVTLIELKRPGRTQQGSDKKNPLQQLFGYVDEIRSGAIRDLSGRPVRVTDGTVFYCYAICDFAQGTDFERAAKEAGLTPSPDGLGYFGYNPSYRCYVEMITFDKLVGDAQQRNRILFQRLGVESPATATELASVQTTGQNGDKADSDDSQA